MEKTSISKSQYIDLLKQYPNNDEWYANMSEREYLKNRVALLKSELGFAPMRLSEACGWCRTALSQMIADKPANKAGRRKQQRVNWEHAATLHEVTHGFISAKYANRAYWDSLNRIIETEIDTKKAA